MLIFWILFILISWFINWRVWLRFLIFWLGWCFFLMICLVVRMCNVLCWLRFVFLMVVELCMWFMRNWFFIFLIVFGGRLWFLLCILLMMLMYLLICWIKFVFGFVGVKVLIVGIFCSEFWILNLFWLFNLVFNCFCDFVWYFVNSEFLLIIYRCWRCVFYYIVRNFI